MSVTATPGHTPVADAEIETLTVSTGLTVIVIVAVEAHCPAVGVNVYVVVAVLFKAGDQVPVMLLFDVVGRALNVSPEQIAGTCVKVGTVGVLIVATTGIRVVDTFQL